MDDAELASNEPPDPYTLLNLSHSALPHEIQQAYKQASRSLHPDKHPPSDRENARDVFTTFKNACESSVQIPSLLKYLNLKRRIVLQMIF